MLILRSETCSLYFATEDETRSLHDDSVPCKTVSDHKAILYQYAVMLVKSNWSLRDIQHP